MGAKEKILSKIFENPSKIFYIRELAREAKVNPNSVINILKELEKENLVKKITKRHIVEISPNFENENFRNKKRIFNLESFYNSKILGELIHKYNPQAVVLYGSFSQGNDLKNSDIDIAVFSDVKEIPENFEIFEKKLGRKIHILVINKNKLTDELYTNIINGIVVYGYVDKK